MNIPFSRISLGGNEFAYVKEVLESGWLTTSAKALRFETQFKEMIGTKFACSVNSCTSALHLALEAAGIGAGDKVLVPSLTFTASAEIIRYLGADPVFVDVDYETGLISAEMIKESISRHQLVKAMILVHFGGQSPALRNNNQNGILDICEYYGIKVIEDAAHAFPSKFMGKPVGSFGNTTCFSFYANKTITTGEGGMLVTDDEDIFNRVKTMRLHGINRDIWNRFTDKQASWEYDVIAPGFKYNMPDINAAIGLAQLEKAEEFRKKRQKCAEFYYKSLGNIDCLDLPVCQVLPDEHAWHLFPVILNNRSSLSRNDFILKMSEAGIGTSVHYKPLHRMSYYCDRYKLSPEMFPNTERIWKGNVSLPIYPDLSLSELEYICQSIHRLLSLSHPIQADKPLKISCGKT